MDVVQDLRSKNSAANPDQVPSAYRNDNVDGDMLTAIEEQQRELDAQLHRYKCLKLQYQGEETKHLFREEAGVSWGVHDKGRTSREKAEAKDRLKAIKTDVGRSEQRSEQLMLEIADQFSANVRTYEQSQRSVQELDRRLAQDSARMDEDGRGDGRLLSAEADLQRLSEDLHSFTQEQTQLGRDSKKLAEELWQIRERRQEIGRAKESLQKTEEQYRLEAQDIQAKEAKAVSVGMADIEFRGSDKVIVGPGKTSNLGRAPEEAIRTIEFKCGDDGNLTHARAHGALKLQEATAFAAQNQDMGYMIKHAYERIQDMSQSTGVGGG